MEGTVKRFDKGYGFITPDNGDKDVFVHFSDIQTESENGFKTLREGERVQFEMGDGLKGPQAKNVTVIDD